MDYNENDSFQSQNHHIAGEGSNKFPPVLRPYALPKFDFDDSLQGHLRFDSLVESEVFLGIENNEDNRWIEDYSRGSCGIEFSKSRIDSCNVSRCNNVWSEATSSESVEMLLKSVGQEEIITTQSVAEVSDAFDELSCLTKSMEPDLKCDTILSKIGDAEELQSAFPLDGVLENSSGLKYDYQGDQSQVEASLQTECGESSLVNNLGNSDLSAGDQCLLYDGQQMVVTATDVSNLVDESGKENLTCTNVHMDDVICNTQNIIGDTVKRQEDVAMVDDVSAISDGLQKDSSFSRDKMNDIKIDLVNHGVDCQNMNHQNLDREAHESTNSHSVNPFILSSSTETIDEQNDSRPNVGALMDASVIIVRSFDAETLKGCGDGVHYEETSQANQHGNNISIEDASVSVPVEASDVVVEHSSDAEKLKGGADEAHRGEISQASQREYEASSKDATDIDKFEDNISTGTPVANEGNKESDSNIEEVSNVNVKQLAGNEQAADPSEEGTDERFGIIYGAQLVIENAVDKDCGQSDSGTSLHSVVDKVSVDDGDGSKGCVSMKLPMEVKIVHSAFEGSNVDVSEMDVDSEISAEPSQQNVSGEKLEGSIPDARSSDPADICQEQSKQLISDSIGHIGTDSVQTVTIEKLEVNILNPHTSDFADGCQEQSKRLSGYSSEDGQTVTDSQPTVPMEKLERNIPDSHSSDAVDVCQEQSKQVVFGFSSEDEGPVLADECLATSTPDKLGSTEDVSYCIEVQKSVEVTLVSIQSGKGDDREASPRGDVETLNQNTDITEAIKCSTVHEPANAALSGNQDLSLHDTTSDCLPKEEGAVDTQSNDEPQLAEAQAQFICQGPGRVEDNIHHVTGNAETDVDTIVTSPEHKESLGLSDNNKLEFEVSDDVSKTRPSTSTPAPLSEGGTTTCVLKDGSEQADETISASITVNKKSSLSINGKEDVVESLSVKDIGVSKVKGDSAVDNPQVSSPEDIDASKIEGSSAPQIVEVSPLASGSVQLDHQTQQCVAIHGGSQSSKENRKQKPKGTPERKARRTSTKAAGRESARKAKDSAPLRQSETAQKRTNSSVSSPGIYQFVQSNEIIPYGQVDGSGTKSFGVLTTTPTSRLPDLNSTAYPSLVFQQPFTDLQQVELRAQIFVYGSLISRQVPEESHMISAFSGPDGGRSMWENVWKVFKARTPSQPSPGLETPSRSGNVASDSVVKQKGFSTPIVRSSTSGTPSSVVNPMIPLSSPLWNIPTPSQTAVQSSGMPRGSMVDFQQAFSQMASQQTPPIISYVGPSNTTWMSQTPFRGPWAASPQATTLDPSVRFPSLLTETVQLTPVRESSLGFSTGTKHVAPVSSTQGGGHAGGVVVSSAAHDLKRAMGPSTQSTNDRKVKRRRKGSTSEDPANISVPSQLRSEKVSDPAKISLPSLSPPQLSSLWTPQLPLPPQSVSRKESFPVAACTVSTPISAAIPANYLTKDTFVGLNVASPPSVAADPAKDVNQGPKKPVLSEDAICKEKEARQQAEDATTLAVAAVSHSQEVWDEIYKKQNSGLMPATEAKLASAAVAIAVAAAVAKAAAAAANVASNAALQAKLMADEALSVDSNTSHEGSSSSGSIITAAKEAASRRVQAASAAALRDDNLDAIVKAAELAAEAISQAGKVVAMGDPLTLRKLAEAGPDGFWKLDLVSSKQEKEGNAGKPKVDKTVSGSSISIKSSDGTPGYQEADANQQGVKLASQENFRNSNEEELRLIVGISGSVTHSSKDTRVQQLEQTSDPAVSASVNLGSESGLGAKDIEMEKAADPKIYNAIREGSTVEVFKDEDEYKGAWFTAKVMNLKDGKAQVCYSEISSSEGTRKLEEWTSLTSDEGQAPKIRAPHPMTAIQYDGSRKRRRAAVGYLTCAVGDKVDAWIRDSWWEGVVTEKNKDDETSLTVSLPALGETSAVKAWNLRPSLIWRDGEWVEWSYARETGSSHREGDTPKEKRPKLGTPANETKGNDKDSKAVENPNPKLGKPEEAKSLDLSDKEKSFNIGTSIDKRKPEIRKPARPGITRKEGPGAIFGVPKPGKKRKFMDVSKHYDGDQDKKVVEVKDSVKLANYMMPRGTGPRRLKSSKADLKEKQGAESKSKGPKSVGITSGKVVPHRNNNSRSSESASEDSAIHVEESGKNSRSGTRFGKGDSQGPFLFSSQDRKTSGAASNSETGNKGRFTPTARKLTKIEENKTLDAVKPASNPSEPARRSVRRIQPTSRLLEGLQSSLLISKIPSSSSYDKSHRPTKTIPKGKNQ